jgi:uncharacterized delta-60 repeat protein
MAVLTIAASTGQAATGERPFPLDATWAADQPLPGLIQMQLESLPAYASLVRTYPDGSAIVALSGVPPVQAVNDNRLGIAKFRPNGTLDPTFNPTGPVPGVASQLSTNGIVDLEIDHHGRILIAGTFMVTRLLADGSPDPSFIATCIRPCAPGQGEPPPFAPVGVVYVGSRVYDIAVLADDSVVVQHSLEFNQNPMLMYMTKLTATGDRDLTFNPSAAIPGMLTIDDAGPGRILPRPDGSFLFATMSTPPRFRRILATGVLDATYGTAGVATPTLALNDERLLAVTEVGSDLLVLVCRVIPIGNPSLLRIHPDGTPDTTFGVGGRLELSRLGITARAPIVFALADQRILVELAEDAGTSIARLTADGHLDASFNPTSGSPGWLVVNPAPDANHRHLILDLAETANGTLLAAGGRQTINFVTVDDVAEIYRFNGFPGAPLPIEPQPISQPPSPTPTPSPSPPLTTIPSMNVAATAMETAVRLGRP